MTDDADRPTLPLLTFAICLAATVGAPDVAGADDTEAAADDESAASRLAPDRVGNMRSVSVMLRPLVSLEAPGLAVAGDAAFEWAFGAPLLLEVQAEPVGFGIGDQPTVAIAAGDASLSYDSRLVRVGVGAGATRVGMPRRAYGESAPLIKSGLTVIQVVRIGARDGLHAKVHNNLLAFDGALRYGDTQGSIRVPTHAVVDDTWLVARGAHQRAGQAIGELGVRVRTSGDGGRGSTYLSFTVGGGGVWDSQTADCADADSFGDGEHGACTSEVLYSGPLVGVGLEQRF
jgi:hypothetical protein